MTDNQLKNVLIELSQASRSITCEEDLRCIMRKYDMLFVGEKYKIIYSLELCHTLISYFEINTDREELNALIPSVCDSLNMKIEPMALVDDLANPDPYCYQISLW